jgi:MFS family permease
VAAALDNPARQTFVSEMVPHDRLSNAVGLSSASFNAARLIGPGVAGLVIAALAPVRPSLSTRSASWQCSSLCRGCGRVS